MFAKKNAEIGVRWYYAIALAAATVLVSAWSLIREPTVTKMAVTIALAIVLRFLFSAASNQGKLP